MGVTCKAWEPKERSYMTKLENQLKKERESNKNKKFVKKNKKDVEDM